ncbi:DDRGK domain-containing protein 1-like [Mizuhopecten yessoensis]|uniref:DDRGK domain-containing protein 1 n=1 Tax=Mizuhopecten yessoensis TaxID=6573 RepID=A0A210QL54_MIZYE|nr:DDRGK domain-containing protein 1-like [Mizuhopecten yessoensis]OWF49482.1 DDRGK domain-containing protein 1 [Mizuhopecten yessoensis]
MAPVDPFTVYISVIAVIAIALVIISIILKTKKKDNKNEQQGPRPGAVRQEVDNVPGGVRRRAPRRGRMQRRRNDDSDGEGDDSDLDVDGEDGTFKFEDVLPAGKGKKWEAKQQAKAERKEQRLMMEEEREEKKKREKLLEKQRKEEEDRQKAEDKIKEEEEKLLKEEEERREHEEYLKIKESFIVEDEGEADLEADLNSQSLLQEFIEHIKTSKVVMLEDLASHFKIRTQDAIDRVQDLVAEGRLTGVIDDRGKFIYITVEELQTIAKYIKQHGRVSITELAESSNRLINLNPDTTSLSSSQAAEVSA